MALLAVCHSHAIQTSRGFDFEIVEQLAWRTLQGEGSNELKGGYSIRQGKHRSKRMQP
jgi:asparagine synthetase B (glutamine-hydrolysing)